MKTCNQSRYLKRTWRQNETLLINIPYRMLEEIRRHRTGRRYSDWTGKSELAIDECLELANRYLSFCPRAMTMDGFCLRGFYVGMSIMCKRFMMLVNTLSKEEKGNFVYRRGSSPKCLAEKRIIYIVFSLLQTWKYVAGRSFNSGYVQSVCKEAEKIVDLKDAKFEARFKESQTDGAFNFLSSVAVIFGDTVPAAVEDETALVVTPTVAVNVDNIVLTAQQQELAKHDRLFEKQDETPVEVEESLTLEEVEAQLVSQNDDATRLAVDNLDEPTIDETTVKDDVVSKKLGYNRFMITNVWEVGNKRLVADEIGKVRQEAVAQIDRKRAITRAMEAASGISEKTQASAIKGTMDVPMAPWTKRIRKRFPQFYD